MVGRCFRQAKVGKGYFFYFRAWVMVFFAFSIMLLYLCLWCGCRHIYVCFTLYYFFNKILLVTDKKDALMSNIMKFLFHSNIERSSLKIM